MKILAVAACVALVAGGRVSSAPARPPSAEKIRAQTKAAVTASGAQLRFLQIRTPNRRYDLRIGTRFPAVYLRSRVSRVVDVVNRATAGPPFAFVRFVIRGPSGTVFWITIERVGSVMTTNWYVEPALEDCVRDIGFNIEVDPDNVAPPCPAR